MCTSQADGGQRCAAHTRPAYQAATFGTAEWDAAAAAYASTPTGRVELASSLAAAEAAEDIRSAVAFEHALREGARLRERSAAVREALHEANDPAAPVAAVTPQSVSEPSDPDSDPEQGWDSSDEYDTDEPEEWDPVDRGLSSQPSTPTMAGHIWSSTDPIFEGCEQSMTTDQFIDQVCENVGITRGEYEAAAARRPDPLDEILTPQTRAAMSRGALDGTDSGGFGQYPGGLNPATMSILTPEQIRAIALDARAARTKQETVDTEALMSAPTPQALTVRSRNNGRIDLPNDADTLRRLSTSRDNEVRLAVARHDLADRDDLARMARTDSEVAVRAAAARHPRLTPETLAECAQDRSVRVRAGAARNPNLPGGEILRLSTDHNATVRGMVARNPSTPEDLVARLANDSSADVRQDVARRAEGALSQSLVRALSTDSVDKVRATVASNRANVPPAILAGLATDSAASVRTAAAKNPNTPARSVAALAADSSPGVRAAVAGRRDQQAETLTRLSSDSDFWVRRNVAWNPSAPQAALARLARDTDNGVRASVAANPSTSAPTQARLSRDSQPAVRVGAAKNRQASQPLLRRLSLDNHPSVRAAVAENPATGHTILRSLSMDPDATVQFVLQRRQALRVRG